ncbi:transporter [Gracilibacillus boraciitolerans JCM 21714]|uniref:Transporter n=1 Tax=Gracilibacillus boraciitolerans JCM 21714 TaxID=1298598 RepID=W4VJ72_9BACI|nr:CAP domain-containing protein [Gracilibacillus boraciitolerans]GAE93206.1 transporter [Gracilibacillus boraciitolerans JCM 21714]
MAEVNQFERQVVALTNKERENAGLAPLQLDTKLSQVARKKSKDMATNGYFSHTSPTYGSPFNMMQQSGVNYRTAGENIAKGQRTPEEVVNGWMNSEGHRANILNGDFTHIGVGYVEDGNHWTQQFIGK